MRASEQDRADVAAARADWRRLTPAIDPDRFVFLDESGVATDLLRRYGRSRRGTRVHDHTPHHHWQTSTFVAELRVTGLTAPALFDGPMWVNDNSGFNLSAQARLTGGVILQGGMSTGKTTADNCDVAPKIDNPSTRFCHNETPFLAQYKFCGSYALPWDVQISGTLQSFGGGPIQASATFTNAQIAPSLGRSLASGATATVTLLQPNTMYKRAPNAD